MLACDDTGVPEGERNAETASVDMSISSLAFLMPVFTGFGLAVPFFFDAVDCAGAISAAGRFFPVTGVGAGKAFVSIEDAREAGRDKFACAC